MEPSEIHANDVLFGRGGFTNTHNVNFRLFVESSTQTDYQALSGSKRRDLITMIVRAVRDLVPRGRFLENRDGLWFEVTDDDKVVKKIKILLKTGKTEAPKRKAGRRARNNKPGGDAARNVLGSDKKNERFLNGNEEKLGDIQQYYTAGCFPVHEVTVDIASPTMHEVPSVGCNVLTMPDLECVQQQNYADCFPIQELTVNITTPSMLEMPTVGCNAFTMPELECVHEDVVMLRDHRDVPYSDEFSVGEAEGLVQITTCNPEKGNLSQLMPQSILEAFLELHEEIRFLKSRVTALEQDNGKVKG